MFYIGIHVFDTHKMPKRSKKRIVPLPQERNERLSMKYSDFTVYDYAKGTKPTVSWHSEVKQVIGQSAVEYVKPLPDDWSEDTYEESHQSVPASELPSIASSNVNLPHKMAGDVKSKHVIQTSGKGNVYPIDLWFLVGEHIQPEDISVFARICHFTHVVVHSAQFWFSVYRRFCQSSLRESPALRFDCVQQRVHGLRTRVIRALFLVYPPLSSRISSRLNPANMSGPTVGAVPPVDPDVLVGRRCVLAWHEHFNKQHWRFYFRFEVSRRTTCSLSPTLSEDSDSLLAPDDVLHNVDERSAVLVAVTPHFLNLPVVMGQVLVKTSSSIDGMFARRLRLIFCSEYMHIGRGLTLPSGAITAEIDSLHSFCILQWWDPSFPSRG